MDDTQLVKLCYWNLDNADTDNYVLRDDIEKSDDYYFGRQPGAAATGRSSAVALECQTMCTAVAAEMIDGFTSDQPAEFEPSGQGDEQAAELESYAVSQVLEDNQGYSVIQAAIDSALRYGNAFTRVSVDDVTETEARTLMGASSDEVAALMAQVPEDVDVKITGATDEKTTIEVTRRTQRVRVEPVDLSLVKYRKDYAKQDISEIPFISIDHTDMTRAELTALFPKKKDIIAELPADTPAARLYSEAQSSKHKAEERSWTSADSRENDLVDWHECYIEVATSGGLTGRRRVCVANHQLLDDVSWRGGPPLAMGVVFPQPHRVQGVSLVNRLTDIQDRASTAQRQLEDNLSAGNLARTYGYDVDLGDVTSGRANGHIRMNSPNSQFGALPPIDQASQSLAYLAFMKAQRDERGGAALSMQETDSQLMQAQIGAVASQQLIGHQEQLSAYISTNFAQTYIRSLYLVIHERLKNDFEGQLMLRVADDWVPVQPSQWQKRTRLTLKAGMSPTARNRKAANLWQVIQLQMGLMQSGAPLADIEGLHAAMRDWGLASDLDSINQYVIDPASQKGQQMAQAQAISAQQQQQMQAQMMQMQVQMEQMDRQLKAQEIADDKANDQAEIKFKYDELAAEMEMKEAELTVNAITNQKAAESESPQGPGGNGSDRPG